MTVLAQVVVGGTFVDVAAVVRHSNLLVSFRTDAHEGADQVLASEFAVVGWCGALVDIYAETIFFFVLNSSSSIILLNLCITGVLLHLKLRLVPYNTNAIVK